MALLQPKAGSKSTECAITNQSLQQYCHQVSSDLESDSELAFIAKLLFTLDIEQIHNEGLPQRSAVKCYMFGQVYISGQD